jgi:uncharacterized membrane protein
MTYLAAYLASLVIFFSLDMVWLSTMAGRIYRPTLGDIALSGVNLMPAIAFYVLYPVGLVIFVVLPALKGGSIYTAIVHGALFGFFTYATYDLTNQATLRNWTLQLSLIDMAWGTVLAALAGAMAFWVVGRLAG